MPIFDSEAIRTVAAHHVGNPADGDSLFLSSQPIQLDETLRDLLAQYFLTPFKAQECYHLYHDDGLDHNPVYLLAVSIFDDPDALVDESRTLAKHLFEVTTHPNIKSGDLFVVYFESCQVEGVTTSAIGLFKAERQSDFLQLKHEGEEGYRIDALHGIDIRHLDKGALIFNHEADKGFLVNVVDSTNRGADAAYWKDDFLGIEERHDDFYSTKTELKAYKQFVAEELPHQFDGVSAADQADLINKSVNYFKQNDSFDLQSFSNEVIGQPEVIESFKEFRTRYQEENAIELQDDFTISDEAVKKQSRSLKSVIKLDKNFHIYVHGNRDLIEQGEDDRGKYYKVYYKEES